MLSTPSKIELLATCDDLPTRLQAVLRAKDRPVCGEARRFAPELSYGRHFGPAPASARQAAVVVLLFQRDGHWHLPLTLRHAALTKHGGQMSLPGGSVEPGELSSQAALRELAEELGVTDDIAIIGRLRECYVYVSDFVVTPWLAATNESPVWQPHPGEVEQIIELPIEALLDLKSVDAIKITRGPLTFVAPCLRYGDTYIWGATCIMIYELAVLIRHIMNRTS